MSSDFCLIPVSSATYRQCLRGIDWDRQVSFRGSRADDVGSRAFASVREKCRICRAECDKSDRVWCRALSTDDHRSRTFLSHSCLIGGGAR